MKIIIHDYAGHPFVYDLSIELVKRGYQITHIYFYNDIGPKRKFKKKIKNLKILPIKMTYTKDNFVKRFFLDIKYSYKLLDCIRLNKSDIIISGQSPSFIQYKLANYCNQNNIRFINWVQDIYSLAVVEILKKKFSYFGKIVGYIFKNIDQLTFNLSNHNIIISDKFLKPLKLFKINPKKISVIENWGNLKDVKIVKKKNNFSKKFNLLNNKFRIVYTGTLGLKHDNKLLFRLILNFKEIEFLIVSSGSGYQQLKNNVRNLKNVKCLPLQPFNQLSKVLGSADCALCLMHKDSSIYSVPSKILNYMCAGKPVLARALKNSATYDLIKSSRCGVVDTSYNNKIFFNQINKLINNRKLLKQYSRNSRKYAVKKFNITNITNQFEKIISQ